MSESIPTELKEKLEKFQDQLATELVLAEPGSDGGQLPVRELLCRLTEGSEGEDPLEGSYHPCALYGLACVDKVLDSLRAWEQSDLDALNSVHEQLKAILEDPSRAFEEPKEVETPPLVAGEGASFFSGGENAPSGSVSEPPAISLDEIEDQELLVEFLNEGSEHLENIEMGILDLEDDPENMDTLNSVFRSFHTLKGGSGFLNLKPLNNTAHELESLLDLARQEKLKVNSGIINLILEGRDILKNYIEAMQAQLSGSQPREKISFPTSELVSRVKDVVEGRIAPEELSDPDASPEPLPQPAEVPPASSQESPPAPTSAPSPEPSVAAASSKGISAPAPNSPRPTQSSVVKVDTHKLDSLFDMVGEMVIAQSLISQDPELLNIRSQKLTRNLAQLSRITNELQKTAMSIRMVPIRATFQKMNRVVRDIASKSGKKVSLKLSGEDTELDRTIVEEISDPLIHMVRNSVDHGIEKTEARLAVGKPAEGEVHLNAFHQGGSIVIQICDDGGGLNKERILAKAVEKGVVSPDQQLSDKEVFGLIFAPGFSTAEKVTDISGRGVGMDVVRKNIEKLRGKIDIESTPAKGTTFSIFLPLTLAIIDGLVVRIGKERYIVPTLSVCESFRPSEKALSTVHERGEMVNVRGHLIPLLRLYKIFDIEPQSENPTEGIVIVLESGHEQCCVLIDDLIGKQEVVIKSLSEELKQNKYLAGAAILGDGLVGLILDTTALVNHR